MDEDEDDVQRVLAGEHEAFARLVARHERALFTFLANLLPRGEDREDAAQEVLLAAFARLASYDPRRARFATWLLAIARHRGLDLLAAARADARAPAPAAAPPRRARAPAGPAARAALLLVTAAACLLRIACALAHLLPWPGDAP